MLRNVRPFSAAVGGVVKPLVTRTVPACVPSLRHRPPPFVACSQRSSPSEETWSMPPSDPGTSSTTKRVPAGVPSVRHSSRPCSGSDSATYMRPLCSAMVNEPPLFPVSRASSMAFFPSVTHTPQPSEAA
jgi:hypothetical protein